MRIIRSKRHKVCADGAFMREVILDRPVDADFVQFLRKFGTIMILPEMGEGFFKFDWKGYFSIKGWIGDCDAEVRFKREVMELTEDFLSSLMYYYHDGSPDMEKLIRMEEQLSERVHRKMHGDD